MKDLDNKFDIGKIQGLSGSEAAESLKRDGFNELPSSTKRGMVAIALDVVKEPMFLLLIAGGGIYFLLGDIREAVMLLGFVFIVMGITLYQERKTERALEALRDLSSPRALVIRDGQPKKIPGREVALRDIVVVAEGDRIPADAILLSSVNLSVDESLLTGESAPVRKFSRSEPQKIERPGGEDSPFVFSGTLAVQGYGIARVHATGVNTEIGRIGKRLQTIEQEETLLQKEIRKLVRNLALLGLSLSVIVVIAYGLTRGDWLNGLLSGIALAMAVLPEEFPVVLTIFLALGAWRLSHKNVLTRRVPAVETLGSASVLCVDKTGTITLNQMSVQKVFAHEGFYDLDGNGKDLPDDLHEVIEFAILASQKDPFDPMEKALRDLGNKTLTATEHLHNDWTLIQEYPLSQNLLAMSRVWKSPNDDRYVIAAKGSPEAIADICHLSETGRESLLEKINAMAGEGLRVIGVAKSTFRQTDLPGEQHAFTFEFLGLIGLADPVRPGIAQSVQECYTAGIRVVMITGDYPVTAQKIASQIGLKNLQEVITGSELDLMDMEVLAERIRSVNIFARVLPEQKLLLVNALKANGEIVAMTGDGVNDAPALKAAHIGIAMGMRGTDVARE
ncbi:MAG: HAD-IC family P-type ATPase, partial [Nitrospirales bacterium]|nr:HAD-IC family P-type ATPase [Nitrospirales bacterium]